MNRFNPSTRLNQTGSVVLFVAFAMAFLLGLMAFVVDAGYLLSEKSQRQNAVEAAAMAGAWNLCSNPEVAARQIAAANDIPNTEDTLAVVIGYYDEEDAYADFTVYKDFVAEGSEDYPSNEFNNAVMVSLEADVPLLMGGLLETGEANVSARAVAVSRCAGLLFFGDDPENSGILINNWRNASSIEFHDMGLIHSNANMEFRNSALASFSGKTLVSASGSIANCPEKGSCLAGEDTITPAKTLDDVMADLEETAASEDRVIDLTDSNFPAYNLVSREGGRYDDEENFYYQNAGFFVFCPHDGDHGGAVYYFRNQGFDDYLAIKGREDTDHARNLTVASENNLAFTSSAGNYLTLGGAEEDTVYFYTKEDVGGGMGGNYGALNHDFRGVIFRTGGDFWVRPDSQTYKLRVVAEGQIHILSFGGYTSRQTVFNANFAPPCPALKVALVE